MTPMPSAASADQQQTWPVSLRIREVSPTAPNSAAQSCSMPYPKTLRTVSGYLHAGWRWVERKRTQQLSSRRLRLAETISLGEKRSVSIVQVDGSQFLIGCSTGSVQLLAVLDKQGDGAERFPDKGGAS